MIEMARLVFHLDYFIIRISTLALSISCRACGSRMENTSPFFIFGDSTDDLGNNNNITSTPFRKTKQITSHMDRMATSENPQDAFSDGRVIVDFIGNHLIKVVK
jgi:hypothetical protein